MLTWTAQPATAAVVLRLTGLLDLAGVAQVRTALHKTLADQPAAIVVDLDALTVEDDVLLTVFAAFARTAVTWPGCAVLLAAPDTGLRAALHRVSISRLLPVYPDSPAAVLAAASLPAPHRFALSLPPGSEAVTAARRTVRDACATWELPHVVDDAELVASELVGNAVRYGGAPVALALVQGRYFLYLSVRDGNPYPPARRFPSQEPGAEISIGGRGLLLVEALAAGWGSRSAAPGKVVWATLRLRRPLLRRRPGRPDQATTGHGQAAPDGHRPADDGHRRSTTAGQATADGHAPGDHIRGAPDGAHGQAVGGAAGVPL
ncbi:ATP-binding protein [Dactylosporangium sp. NPDC005555]|uniref:ATP-binding protein n=1 Tax=Dactylosporangium sp. NPDC005555 TaxID=3154889 RepID=UPI0033A0DC7E